MFCCTDFIVLVITSSTKLTMKDIYLRLLTTASATIKTCFIFLVLSGRGVKYARVKTILFYL